MYSEKDRPTSPTTMQEEITRPTGPAWGWQHVAEKWLQPRKGLLAQKSQRTKPKDWESDPFISKPRRFTKQKFALAVVGLLMLFSSLSPALHAATIEVDKQGVDGFPGCDLADAINIANTDNISAGDCVPADITGTLTPGGADTITFDSTVFALGSQLVVLPAPFTPNNGNGDNGLPVITSTITINGGVVTQVNIFRDDISQSLPFRIFEVDGQGGTGGKLTLKNLFINRGQTSGTGTGNDAKGGGIFLSNNAALTMDRAGILSSTASDSGGGIFADSSPVTITSSFISSNSANGSGGGIWAKASGAVTVTNSILRDNNAMVQGGALFFADDAQNESATIKDSCIVNNSQDAIHNAEPQVAILAQSNWWGAPDGPGAILRAFFKQALLFSNFVLDDAVSQR